MKWNKVSEVGFPKLEEINTSVTVLCATRNEYFRRYETLIMRYEKRCVRGNVIERWKRYSSDNIYYTPENIIAWAEIPVYNPEQERLIDADALKREIPETSVSAFENCRNCTLLDKEAIIGIIDKQPTVE